MNRLQYLVIWAALGSMVLSPAVATAEEPADDAATIYRVRLNDVSALVRAEKFADAITQSAKLNGCEFGLHAPADPTTFAYLTNLAVANRRTQQPERAARCVVAAAAHANSNAELATVMYEAALLLEKPNRTTLAMLAGSDRFYDPTASVGPFDDWSLRPLRRPTQYVSDPRLPDTEAERLAVLPAFLEKLRLAILNRSFHTFPTREVAQELLKLGVSRDSLHRLRERVFSVTSLSEPYVVVSTLQEARIWMSALRGKPPRKCPIVDPYEGCGTREIVAYPADGGPPTALKRTSPGFQLAAVVDRGVNEDESWASAHRFILYTDKARSISIFPLPGTSWSVSVLDPESGKACEEETTAVHPVPSPSLFAGVHGARPDHKRQDRFLCSADGGPICIVTSASCTADWRGTGPAACAFPDLTFDEKGHLVADISKLDENVWGPLRQYLNGPMRQVDSDLDTVAGTVFTYYGLW